LFFALHAEGPGYGRRLPRRGCRRGEPNRARGSAIRALVNKGKRYPSAFADLMSCFLAEQHQELVDALIIPGQSNERAQLGFAFGLNLRAICSQKCEELRGGNQLIDVAPAVLSPRARLCHGGRFAECNSALRGPHQTPCKLHRHTVVTPS
jgi:hypothetical protein